MARRNPPFWPVLARAEGIAVEGRKRRDAAGPEGGTSAAGLPRRREAGLDGTAVFSVDGAGLVRGWTVTAAGVFGLAEGAVTGRDVCDTLLTVPGQRELVRRALDEVREGRIWNGTVAGGGLGEGRVALRFEPCPAPYSGAVVLARRLTPSAAAGWISEAASQIGTSLDLNRTASEIADAVVPGFADAVSVYVAERLLTAADAPVPRAPVGAMAVRRLAARLGGHEQAVTDGVLHPGEVLFFGPGTPAGQAIATGEAALFREWDRETAERIFLRPGADVMAYYASFLIVPLLGRGEVIGAIAFGRTLASPAFNAVDVSQARELGARAVVHIENARMFDRERRTALALKRGLLPSNPDIPPGLEVAHRYLPVGDSVIGGDWHDIVALPGGRAALIVGDVMGHGPEAAAVMVQVRTAAHTLADLGLPPGQILAKLDQMVARMSSGQFATCVYVVTDPAAGTCVIAQAGHLPPVLIHPGGVTEVLELPPGLPVGLGAGIAGATEISLPPGATLALFTDGLVEGRARPIDEGLAVLQDALAKALADPGIPLADAAAEVTRQLCERSEDDVTLVLSRVRGNL